MTKKKNIQRKVFKLLNREYITPRFIRLTLGGNDVSDFKETTIGVNNKVFIAPKGCSEVYLPEFDFEKGAWKPQEESTKPYVRTYTHRGINIEKNELYIDFVAHGDEGPASDFAINAEIGSQIGVAMGCEASELVPEVEWYYLIGDATAIPVLSAILESLPNTAKAKVIIEVETEEDVQNLSSEATFDIEWVINPTPGQNSQVASKVIDFVNSNALPESKFVYLASEFSTVKELRNFFRKEKNWSREDLYAYSYWKFGKAESASEADRRAEKDSDQ
ncbi:MULTISPECIES: siderophore-interacting protein [Myroides]|uniref:Siderophore-interacting protein n=1 Tax=Myroides albus TaxID=2562892 RepID=A0A6I3LSI5_9FLAO|nr:MULTISPECIES: siderophore-interacting protein [Myroides]MTG98945.1 siderophore-interacting protein [Myroides albus]MVX35515.1 siderophore-interacting protein [Myroides sp. LoEW2-1]UVD78587.1 siderophore-interacting protein [Myroides albus]